MAAFAGPGFLVAVGYMDPGNWATDLAGGAKFGYTLLCVVMVSNLMAILLQHLCIKLGVVTGRDLAQACRDHYSRPTGLVSLGPVRGGHRRLRSGGGGRLGHRPATALRHPAGLGLRHYGADVLLVLFLQNKGFRYVEALVVTLIVTIGLCFAAELFFARPSLTGVAARLCPQPGHPQE